MYLGVSGQWPTVKFTNVFCIRYAFLLTTSSSKTLYMYTHKQLRRPVSNLCNPNMVILNPVVVIQHGYSISVKALVILLCLVLALVCIVFLNVFGTRTFQVSFSCIIDDLQILFRIQYITLTPDACRSLLANTLGTQLTLHTGRIQQHTLFQTFLIVFKKQFI